MKTFPKIITSWRHVLIEWEILLINKAGFTVEIIR